MWMEELFMENGRSRLLNHGRSFDSGVITAPWESFPLSTGWFPERKPQFSNRPSETRGRVCFFILPVMIGGILSALRPFLWIWPKCLMESRRPSVKCRRFEGGEKWGYNGEPSLCRSRDPWGFSEAGQDRAGISSGIQTSTSSSARPGGGGRAGSLLTFTGLLCFVWVLFFIKLRSVGSFT